MNACYLGQTVHGSGLKCIHDIPYSHNYNMYAFAVDYVQVYPTFSYILVC